MKLPERTTHSKPPVKYQDQFASPIGSRGRKTPPVTQFHLIKSFLPVVQGGPGISMTLVLPLVQFLLPQYHTLS